MMMMMILRQTGFIQKFPEYVDCHMIKIMCNCPSIQQCLSSNIHVPKNIWRQSPVTISW